MQVLCSLLSHEPHPWVVCVYGGGLGGHEWPVGEVGPPDVDGGGGREAVRRARGVRTQKYLEDVVGPVVVVPILLPAAVVAQAELHAGPHGQAAHGHTELELVRGPVAGALHVGGRHVRRRVPVVGRPADSHSLAEAQVGNPDDTAHGEGGLHEGVLEADLARRHGLVEGR